MKKMLSLLAILMVTMTAVAEDNIVEVSTWQGIKEYMKSSTRSTTICKLIADIDFGGGTISCVSPESDRNQTDLYFCIDGNGHTIKNGKLVDEAMFSCIGSAVIKDLNFRDIESNIYVLAIEAGQSSRFENLTFTNCKTTDKFQDCSALVCALTAESSSTNPVNFTNITIVDCNITGNNYVGAILGKSKSLCAFTNCHVYRTKVRCDMMCVGGLVGEAKKAKFDNCSFDGEVYADETTTIYSYCGGIIGRMYEGSITNCTNKATVSAGENQVGGIVGHAEKTTITGCKNTGWVHHIDLVGPDDDMGGIIGYGKDITISKCINEGSIDCGDAYCGGIAGRLEGNSSVTYCVNNAFVNGDEYVGGIAGQTNDGTTVSFCIGASNRIEGNSHVQILVGEEPAGSTHDNYWISETSNIEEGAVTAADLKSGKVAWHISNKLITASQDYVWGQAMTNKGICFEDYPIPGGKRVYQHTTNCKGETCEFYSNYEHNHYGDIIKYADGRCVCTYCNNAVENGESYVTGFNIYDAQDLSVFSAFINAGNSFVDAYLCNDIDCSSLTSFTPIGTFPDKPYKGTFDGKGYRIKNLTVNRSDSKEVGLFGCVSGTTTISNLIIDSSCQFTGTGYGTAGIVGCLALPTANNTDGVINFKMIKCGNEAKVTGNINAAGLVGGVYNSESSSNVKLNISHCYNSGDISGTEQSAALLAYGLGDVTVSHCFNVGNVTGCDTDHSLIRLKDYNSLTSSRVYNLSTVAKEVKAMNLTSASFVLGVIASFLNDEETVWGQNIGTDAYPNFSNGLRHEREIKNYQWGTVCLPFAIKSDDKVQLFTMVDVSTETGGVMTFTPVETVNAYTPCVFKKKNAEADSVMFTATGPIEAIEFTLTTNPIAGWTMTGTFEELTGKTGIYYISNDKFWYADAATKVPAFRAWFTGPAPTNGNAKSFTIQIADGDQTTTIGEISADGKVTFNDTPIYNIAGQRLSAPHKGLNIIGNRKVYIK